MTCSTAMSRARLGGNAFMIVPSALAKAERSGSAGTLATSSPSATSSCSCSVISLPLSVEHVDASGHQHHVADRVDAQSCVAGVRAGGDVFHPPPRSEHAGVDRVGGLRAVSGSNGWADAGL